MTVTAPHPEAATAPPATPEAAAQELTHCPGRWIGNWNPESPEQRNSVGKAIASCNLRRSIFAVEEPHL